MIERLSQHGIHVLIDDFGTGYSSLSYLHQFRVSTLKIDRTFVTRIAEREQNLEIVRTIIALARALRLTVVAEGVETAEEQRQLRLLDCDEVQGFFFASPNAPDHIERLLANPTRR